VRAGYNPFYKNSQRSIEIHLLHTFREDFYGATLSLIILGYIRPEFDYVSKEALVGDIREDIRISQRSLDRAAYQQFKDDPWLKGEGAGSEIEAVSAGGVGQKDGVGISQAQ
jgi:riboflavin kinase